MLRSIVPHETPLVKLCHEKKWAEARLRAQAYPDEANPTSSAYRGVGTTALAIAVRSGAPLETVKAIVDANADQILRVWHCRRGTVLHEAIRHRASIDVVSYLIHTIIRYEDLRMLQLDGDESSRNGSDAQKNRVHYTSLFSQTDDLGRTPLHHMADRASRDAIRSCHHAGIIDACHSMAKAYPPAVGLADIDGNTPLILVLVTPPPSASNMEVEIRIVELLRTFLEHCPKAASLADPTTAMGLRSAAAISALQARSNQHLESGSVSKNGGPQDFRQLGRSKAINMGPNPLSYALMYGRSISTIRLLLESCSISAHSSCTAIVSSDYEVPLLIAVTMRAPADVISLLLEYAPEAAARPDKYGLTPLCWAWIRHVVDRPFFGESSGTEGLEGSNADIDGMESSALPPMKASKRRYVPVNFSQLLDEAAEEIESVTNPDETSRRVCNAAFQHYQTGIGALWEKVAMMLPCAAKTLFLSLNAKNARHGDTVEKAWPVVHAASYLSCPLALLDLAIYYYPDQVRVKDAYGNLPIHYAANRSGFVTSRLPVGVTQTPQRFAESSPVFELLRRYPDSCRVTDSKGRLPLHIALDFAKVSAHKAHITLKNSEHQHQSVPRCRNVSYVFGSGKAYVNDSRGMELLYAQKASLSVVTHILDKFTGALERRDPASKLYPFMQAAEGDYADINIIFILLQEHPTLVSLGIPV